MATREDFKQLRVPLVVAAVVVAICAALIVGMRKWTEEAKREQQQAQVTQNEARGKLARAREEEMEIKRNLQQYQALVSKGIVGEENRLDWIERINAIRLAHKLYDIRSEISEQRKLDSTVTSGPDIMVSRMDLGLPLLDEDDLFVLLGDLRASRRGYFQVKSCRITRGNPVDRKTLAPTMDAACQLDFYTIREHSDIKVAGS
jgi:hypothetical protein